MMVLGKNKMKKQINVDDGALADVPVWVKAVSYIITTSLALSTLIPLLLCISVSFTDNTALALNGYQLIPEKCSLDAYAYIAKTGEQIINSYAVSISTMIMGTLIGILAMTAFCYAITRKEFDLVSDKLVFFVYFTMLFNGGTVATYMVISNVLHLRDTFWVLVIPGCISSMYIMIIRTYMKTSIPDAVIESAKLDGAGDSICYFRIVLPMCVPVIATIMLFLSVHYWNSWYNAFLYIVKSDFVPLQLLLKRIEKDISFLQNSASGISEIEAAELRKSLPTESFQMAMVVLVVGPILIAYPFFQKYFVKGVTVGSVKG